ncbi:MAG: hypothetical protein GXP27_04040, partial [Planctomycetes bacterium]|nr:hypothetical protein [Planctomycetota bacterium]
MPTGHVLVSFDRFLGLGNSLNGEGIKIIDPMTFAFQDFTAAPGQGGTAGKLARVKPDRPSHLPSWVQGNDVLNLLPSGIIAAIRPATQQVGMLISLKSQLVSASRGGGWNVDNLNIFDTYTGRVSGFGGTILPEAAFYEGGDIAVYQDADFTDILVTGMGGGGGIPFAMRLRYMQGQLVNAKVLVSSIGTLPGGQVPPGIGVNDFGIVLTSMPVPHVPPGGVPNANTALSELIAFDVDFDSPGNAGRTPFQPFPYDPQAPTVATSGLLQSAGITTDAFGNFYIAPRQETNAANPLSGYYFVTNDVAHMVFQPYQVSSVMFPQRDVAVSPDLQYAYFTTTVAASSGANFQHQIIAAPIRPLPDLAFTVPSGWSDAAVVSTQQGTNSDATSISTSDEVYVDVSVANLGTAATIAPVNVGIFLDGQFLQDLTQVVNPPLTPNSLATAEDLNLGRLSAGPHKLEVVLLSNQPQWNGFNDKFVKEFTVSDATRPPNAQDDAASTDEDVPVDINVLANDTDPDGDTLTVTQIVSSPSNGQVAINASGTIRYTPNANYY